MKLETIKIDNVIQAKEDNREYEQIKYCKNDSILNVIVLDEFWQELKEKIEDKKVIEIIGEIIGTNPIFQIPAGALLHYTKYYQDQEQ